MTKDSPLLFFPALRDFFPKKKFSPKGPPCIFFDVLWQNGSWKIPKGPPFQFFSALWDFFPKIKIFVFFNFFMFCDRMDVEKPKRVLAFSFSALWELARHSVQFFWVCNFFEIFFCKKFQFSSTVKEYLTLGSRFAISEPWIWRRLGPVPACLYTYFQFRSNLLQLWSPYNVNQLWILNFIGNQGCNKVYCIENLVKNTLKSVLVLYCFGSQCFV